MDLSWLTQVWVWIIGGLSGLTIGSIITAICVAAFKRVADKIEKKHNAARTEEKAVEKGIATVKSMTFKHSIQPIVESEIAKINESAIKSIKKELDEIKAQYTKLVLIIKKLAAYFDDSIVSEAKKEELHEAIGDAETTPLYAESVVLEEALKEEYEPEITSKEEETETTVER